MRRLLMLVLSLALAACGAGETVGVAAVEAEAKAKDIEAGKRLEAETKARLEQALAAEQKKLQDAETGNR